MATRGSAREQEGAAPHGESSRGFWQAPGRRLRELARDQGLGGAMLRRVLPLAVAIPIAAGWASLSGARLGLYDLPVATALFALTNILSLGSIVVGTAAGLRRLDGARSEAAAALRETEERFRSVAENLPEVIAVVRPGDRREYLSPYYFRYTGQTLEEAAGDGWVRAIHPEDAEASLQAWKRAVEGASGYELEQRMRRSDGVYRWHLVRTAAMLGPGGEAVRWISTATDVDDGRRLQEALERYAARLERSNRELESFAYVASHDLQEPLRTLAGFSDLLSERYRDQLDAEAAQVLHRVRQGASRMHLALQKLLALSPVEAHPAPFDPAEEGEGSAPSESQGP